MCPAGSASNRLYPCGNASVYCPEGSAFPLPVGIGNYSLSSTTPDVSVAQARCPQGAYCVDGVKVRSQVCLCSATTATVRVGSVHDRTSPVCVSGCTGWCSWWQTLCAAGRFGSVAGQIDPLCSGVCADGFQCTAGSASPTAAPCDAGYACENGTRTACSAGYYSTAQSTTCTPCAAGRFSASLAAVSVAACLPCPQYVDALVQEGSYAGAAACWPGVRSVNASNPPPLVPGFSVGDVVTLVFTKATNSTSSPVVFSPSIGRVAFSWLNQGSTLVRELADDCAPLRCPCTCSCMCSAAVCA